MDKFGRLCIQMDDDIDRISSLADAILTHILTFLTAKQAVHTFTLSKRWKNVWAFVPVLNFDLREFEKHKTHCWHPTHIPCLKGSCLVCWKTRRQLQLDSFWFLWHNDDCLHDASFKWLHHVASVNLYRNLPAFLIGFS
jgi:hypothetical protein